MNGILYFSSTGNSLDISLKIKERFGGSIIYIPTYDGTGKEFDKLFIVTPIYSYGLPIHVLNLLPRLDKKVEIYVIQNYGGMTGGADYLFYKYALKYGLNIKSMYLVKMPENFTLTFSVPKFYMNKTLKKSRKVIERILNDIESNNYKLPRPKRTKEKTYLKNKQNWHKIGERFSINSNCIMCSKCINLCPVSNITMVDSRIVFSDKCTACLGCYHRCPTKAIVYMNKKKKDRYINPNIKENTLGTDIK